MPEQMRPSSLFPATSETAGDLRYVPCAECNGQGEIGTSQDYFGNWNTRECRCCQGHGEITTERAADWRALLEDYS